MKLAAANEDLVYGALQTAWKLRVEKNQAAGRKGRAVAPRKKKTSRGEA